MICVSNHRSEVAGARAGAGVVIATASASQRSRGSYQRLRGQLCLEQMGDINININTIWCWTVFRLKD